VSYRWQGVEEFICPGLKLNMSRWQMEQLVAALSNTSCFYVWIDRLSVPQYESELQNTLLSRMMGTFANARETLVLRSMEENGSRYHQRAWCGPPSNHFCSISHVFLLWYAFLFPGLWFFLLLLFPWWLPLLFLVRKSIYFSLI
jgi:hypothetical protein